MSTNWRRWAGGFFYHYLRRQAALLASPVQMILGSAALCLVLALLTLARQVLEVPVACGGASPRMLELWMLHFLVNMGGLYLLVFVCGARGADRGVTQGQSRLGFETHPTLPVSPRARALAEATAWLPVWWLVLPLGVYLGLYLLLLPAWLKDEHDIFWHALQSPWSAVPQEDWRAVVSALVGTLSRACLAIPLLTAYGMIERRSAVTVLRKLAPWVVLYLLVWRAFIELSGISLAITITLLTTLALLMPPSKEWRISLPQLFMAGTRAPLIRPSIAAPIPFRKEAWRGTKHSILLLLPWAILWPATLDIISGLSFPVILAHKLSSIDHWVWFMINTATIAMLGPILRPLGLWNAAARLRHRRSLFDGSLRLAWANLPIRHATLARAYHVSVMGALVAFFAIQGGWSTWNQFLKVPRGASWFTTIKIICTQGLPPLDMSLHVWLIGGLLSALAIGTLAQRTMAITASVFVYGLLLTGFIVEVIFPWLEWKSTVWPEYMFTVPQGIAACAISASLLWPRNREPRVV